MNGQNNVGKVLVIGAGVSGLTTALCLKEKGFEVISYSTPKLLKIAMRYLGHLPHAS